MHSGPMAESCTLHRCASLFQALLQRFNGRFFLPENAHFQRPFLAYVP